MTQQPDVRAVLTNRLLDEGIILVVKAAQAEGISIGSKTALRWCIAGIRGVRLESVKIGGRRMTSRAALRRFVAATQDRMASFVPPTRPSLSAEAADRVLASYGLARHQSEARSLGRNAARHRSDAQSGSRVQER